MLGPALPDSSLRCLLPGDGICEHGRGSLVPLLAQVAHGGNVEWGQAMVILMGSPPEPLQARPHLISRVLSVLRARCWPLLPPEGLRPWSGLRLAGLAWGPCPRLEFQRKGVVVIRR